MAAPVAVQTFVTAAQAFAAAAQASSGSAADPSLLLSLNQLPSLCAAAIAALRASPAADPEASQATSACEVLLANCAALGDALLAQRPPLGAYTVPQDSPLTLIVQNYYGGDALSWLPQVLADNPQILGLAIIPSGTPLKLAAKTTGQ